MKKRIFILLVLLCALLPAIAAAASVDPAETYEPGPKEDIGAWSYLKVVPVNGDRDRTHYIFSNYQTTTLPIEGKVERVNGISYNKNHNTVTLTDYRKEDVILLAHNMGTGFTVKLAGKNILRSIRVENENWDSGLSITGAGTIALGNTSDHYHVPLDVAGDLFVNCGKLVCHKEITDLRPSDGYRQTVCVKSVSETPLSTTLNFKKEFETNRNENGTCIVRTTEDITFTGKALKTPGVKRSGKKVSWSKVKGCSYQVKIGSKITTTKKNSIKSKGKLYVRAIKVQNGIMTCSAWSKKV